VVRGTKRASDASAAAGRAKRARDGEVENAGAVGGTGGRRRALVVPKPRAFACVTNASDGAVVKAPVVKKVIPAPRAPAKSVASETATSAS